jgi:hypothetical protein
MRGAQHVCDCPRAHWGTNTIRCHSFRRAISLNFKQNWASLRRLAELDLEILAVGHGDPITRDGSERLRTLLKKSCHWPSTN